MNRKKLQYQIFRAPFRRDEDGTMKQHPREWLHVRPSGRYAWTTDQSKADNFNFAESCSIIDNLYSHGDLYSYNYSKIVH